MPLFGRDVDALECNTWRYSKNSKRSVAWLKVVFRAGRRHTRCNTLHSKGHSLSPRSAVEHFCRTQICDMHSPFKCFPKVKWKPRKIDEKQFFSFKFTQFEALRDECSTMNRSHCVLAEQRQTKFDLPFSQHQCWHCSTLTLAQD